MGHEIFMATNNKGKVKEIQALLGNEDLVFKMIKDFPRYEEVEETGSSFAENALLKARYGAKTSGLLTLADDSGLEVDYLKGAPGIFSARFSGKDATDEKNNQKLLEELKGVAWKDRTARFVCVIALVTPDGFEVTKKGTVEGIILEEARGKNGFGYDPLFYIEAYQKTFGELPEEIKNRISHRANAVRLIEEEIRKRI